MLYIRLIRFIFYRSSLKDSKSSMLFCMHQSTSDLLRIQATVVYWVMALSFTGLLRMREVNPKTLRVGRFYYSTISLPSLVFSVLWNCLQRQTFTLPLLIMTSCLYPFSYIEIVYSGLQMHLMSFRATSFWKFTVK